MVYVVLILAAVALLSFAFGLLGNLPATPDWLVGTSSLLVEYISWPVHILASILNDHLFYGSLIIVAAVMAWEPVYHSIMWVLRKIPILGIK